MNFDDSFTRLLGNEGGYSDNSSDPGGKTMWGITEAVARACGYTGEMRDMPQDVAKAIYKPRYWDPISGDSLGDLAFHVFDAAVNSGVRQATIWLQQALGVTADGVIGPGTRLAIAQADIGRATRAFNGARLAFMTDLPTWPSFGRGWAKRIANNLRI